MAEMVKVKRAEIIERKKEEEKKVGDEGIKIKAEVNLEKRKEKENVSVIS